MLLPKVRYPDAPLFTKGCAHEDSKKTPVSEDLCHVRSANPNKRKICERCTSPYKARVLYRPDKDVPDAPRGAPGALERLMVAHFQNHRSKKIFDADDENDDDVAEEAVQPEKVRQSGSKGPRKRQATRGKQLLEMATTIAEPSKGGLTVKDVCEGMGIDQGKYYDLLHIYNASAELHGLIIKYSLSLAAALTVGKFPANMREDICKRLDSRLLTMSKLQWVLRTSKTRGGDLRTQCARVGINWPESVVVSEAAK